MADINFDIVKAQDIRGALDYLANNPWPDNRDSKTHSILFAGREYPLKLVLEVAYWIAATGVAKIEKIGHYTTQQMALVLKAEDFAKEIGYEIKIVKYQNTKNGGDHSENGEKESMTSENRFDKNIILYGPPGTGKTYNAAIYAVAIVEGKSIEEVRGRGYDKVFEQYKQYKEDNLIEFTTFHQSYGYEEFIEGIRPLLSEDDDGDNDGEIKYELHDGVFKKFCSNAELPISSGKTNDIDIDPYATVWKVSLQGTGENPVRADCLKNSYIRVGYEPPKEGEKAIREAKAFHYRMKIGDIVMSCYLLTTAYLYQFRREIQGNKDYQRYYR